MSQENLARVRAITPPDGTDLVEVFAGTERPYTSGGLMSDDVVIRFTSESAGEMGGAGADAFYDTWRDWLEPWETYRIYNEGLVDRGDRIVSLVRLRGTTRRGGVEMEHEAAAVFRFEGDQVVEITFTTGRDAALDE